MKTVRMMFGAVAMLAGFAAWGNWTYPVTVNDLVSQSYSVRYEYLSKFILPNPSSTREGYIWGGWSIKDACTPFATRLPSGASYEICGDTELTAVWLDPDAVGKVKSVPKPKVKIRSSYPAGLSVTWSKASGASFYMVRRGTSKTYSKSKVIAYTAGTSYTDTYPDRNPKKKFYYWVVPCNKAWKGKADSSKYAYGSTKLRSFSASPSIPYDNDYNRYAYVGDKIAFVAKRNGYSFSASQCKWKIVSGAKFASISKSGVLTAKKKGKVVISASYSGKTVKKTVTIKAHTSVDVAIFKEMANSYYWGGLTLVKSGNDYVWSGSSSSGANRIDRMTVGEGGIVSVTGTLDGESFSGKGRFCASTGNYDGSRETWATFDTDVGQITITMKAQKSYAYWDLSIQSIQIFGDDWDDDDW